MVSKLPAKFATTDLCGYPSVVANRFQTLQVRSEGRQEQFFVPDDHQLGESPSNHPMDSGRHGILVDFGIAQDCLEMRMMMDGQAGGSLGDPQEALAPFDRQAHNSSLLGTVSEYSGHGGLGRTPAPLSIINSRASPADSPTFEPSGRSEQSNDYNGVAPVCCLTQFPISTSQSSDPLTPCSNTYPPACSTHTAFLGSATSPPDDSIDGRLAPTQSAFAGRSQCNHISEFNKFKIKKILHIYDAEFTALCERVQNQEGLVAMVHHIVESAWYKEGKQEQLPDHRLQKYIPKRRSIEARGSPFGAFVSPNAPYICYLCEESTSRSSVLRAIGHARQHFGRTIDGHYTNTNTRKDQERRAKAPTYHCLHCDKSITVQNKVRHEASAGHCKKVQTSLTIPTIVLQ